MSIRPLPNRRKISAKDVRELLSDSQWSHDEAHSKLVHFEVYNHPDGRVLTVRYDRRGILYPSPQDFAVLLDHFNEARTQEPQHILKGRFPYGADFVQYVPRLVDQLAVLFKIPRNELDNTDASLDKVDAKVKRIGRAKSLEVPIFPSLVAYVGEVMRQATNGKWEMRLNDIDGKTWEPWIVDPEGRYCNPFLAVYDELAEQYPFSIRGATGGRIISRQALPSSSRPRTVAIYKSTSD